MERKTRFCSWWFFFSLKVPGGHVIYRRNERVAWNGKFHLSYKILLPRRANVWLPSPTPSVCTDGRSYADVITNFLGWIDYQIFLAMGLHDNIIIISWALAREARTGAPWVRKCGKSMHPRNFGSEKIIRTGYLRPPLHVSRDEILHFKHPRVSAVNRIASRPFRNIYNNNKSRFFLST